MCVCVCGVCVYVCSVCVCGIVCMWCGCVCVCVWVCVCGIVCMWCVVCVCVCGIVCVGVLRCLCGFRAACAHAACTRGLLSDAPAARVRRGARGRQPGRSPRVPTACHVTPTSRFLRDQIQTNLKNGYKNIHINNYLKHKWNKCSNQKA